MSLVDKIKQWYADGESAPPTYTGEFMLVDIEPLEEKRWGTLKRWVFQDGVEFVAVEDVEPATEVQDWGDYGEPSIYPVEPYEVSFVEYRPLT